MTHTGGSWSSKEKEFHINCLEILAAFLAVKTFLKSRRPSRLPVDGQLDGGCICKQHGWGRLHTGNTDRQGSVDVVPPERHHFVGPVPPGQGQHDSRQELREMKDHSDWLLNSEVFGMILHHFLSQNVNLFASHLTFQLPRFFSWRLNPVAEATDALQQNWKSLSACQPAMESRGASSCDGGNARGRSSPGCSDQTISAMVPEATELFMVCPTQNSTPT